MQNHWQTQAERERTCRLVSGAMNHSDGTACQRGDRGQHGDCATR